MDGGIYGDEERLRLLIVRVGDDGPAKVSANINKLLTVIATKEHTHKEIITELLVSSIASLPDKPPIYATFLSMLNMTTHAYVIEIFQDIVKKYYQYIEKSDFLEVKNILAFFIFSTKCNLLNIQTSAEIILYMLKAYKQCNAKYICLIPIVYLFPLIVRI